MANNFSDFELREIAQETFAKHWEKKTGKKADVATLYHMSYCIDAILEFGKKAKEGKLE